MAATKTKHFNLLRSFSLLSFLSIALITAVSGVLLSRFLTENMLTRDAMVTQHFVQGIALLNDPSVYIMHLSSRGEPSRGANASPQKRLESGTEAIEEFFTHIVAVPEVLRVNVYNHDQQVIWSSQPHLLGKYFPGDLELRQALAGNLAVKTGSVQQHLKAEHVNFARGVTYFVENYIPLWNASGDTVIGVVETYKEPQALFRAVDKGNRLVWTIAVVGGLFLYGSLFWIVRRASQVIQRQQQQLVESETMAAIGEMASVMAHNLRNSLASIRSSAEITLEETAAISLRESATDIIASVDHLEQWIRQLLTYANPIQHTPMAVQVDCILRETLHSFQPELCKQGIKVAIDMADPLPPLHADIGLLQQPCHCLIANAIEAMPKGGTLSVRLQLTADCRSILICITDTGMGIPPEQLHKVFKPFFTTKRKGLGVGLALVKRIVEMHGGSIGLSSTVGQGTTVSLSVPLTE